MHQDGAGDFDELIVITNDGFEPRNVTIAAGERVRFVNEEEEPAWPASALHPTHSFYPEQTDSDCLGSSFDSCRGLEASEYWEFTFEHAGEWRYHDHLRSYLGGIITVE